MGSSAGLITSGMTHTTSFKEIGVDIVIAVWSNIKRGVEFCIALLCFSPTEAKADDYGLVSDSYPVSMQELSIIYR